MQYLEYLLIALIILSLFLGVFYYLLRKNLIQARNNQKHNKPKEKILVSKSGGFVHIDAKDFLNGEFLENIIGKVNLEENPKTLERCELYIRPYTIGELFTYVQQNKAYSGDSKGLVLNTYQGCITASAMLFDFDIPEYFYLDASNVAVISHIAVYVKQNTPVSISEELELYLENNQDTIESIDEHKEVKSLEQDISLFNKMFADAIEHEYFLSISLLYAKWLESPFIKHFNYEKYKTDINYFKKLVTMYYGTLGVDVPKSYLCFTIPITQYIKQERRYSPTTLKLVKPIYTDLD